VRAQFLALPLSLILAFSSSCSAGALCVRDFERVGPLLGCPLCERASKVPIVCPLGARWVPITCPLRAHYVPIMCPLHVSGAKEIRTQRTPLPPGSSLKFSTRGLLFALAYSSLRKIYKLYWVVSLI
jgi:hypothetical protein